MLYIQNIGSNYHLLQRNPLEMLVQNRNSQTLQNETQAVAVRTEAKRKDTQLRVNFTTPYIHHYQVNGNRIEFIQQFTAYYSQIMLEDTIPRDSIYCFSFKLVKCYHGKNSAIFVGITRQQCRDYRNSHFDNNVFTYFGKKHLVWPGRMDIGHGFGQEDIVTVKVNQKENNIEWYVNGEKQVSIKNTFLSQHSYIPFLQMNEPGDVIEYLGSWQE